MGAYVRETVLSVYRKKWSTTLICSKSCAPQREDRTKYLYDNEARYLNAFREEI